MSSHPHLHDYHFLWQDFSLNIEEVKELTRKFHPDLVFVESGGDNLAANFSRELADFIIYVIDVAGRSPVGLNYCPCFLVAI